MTKLKIQPPTVKRKTDSQKESQTQEKMHAAGDHGGTKGSQKVADLLARVLHCPRGLWSPWIPGPTGMLVGRDSGLSTEPDQVPKGQRVSAACRTREPPLSSANRPSQGLRERAPSPRGPGQEWGLDARSPSPRLPPAPAVALQDNGCPAVTPWCGGSPRPASDPGPPSLPLSPLPSTFPPLP